MMVVAPTTTILVRFAKLASAGLLPLFVVALGGGFLTHRVAGTEGLNAMAVGCAVGLVGNWFGTVPVSLVKDLGGQSAGMAVLLGTCIRFLAVLMLAAPVALSGWVERSAFLGWVAASYLVVLFGETVMLVILTGHARRGSSA